MYDLWGRKTTDPAKAVNSIFSRYDDMEFLLIKYPIELDEEWIIATQNHYNEDGQYVCDFYLKGRYDLHTSVQVQAGDFSILRYQYFNDGPSEYPILNRLMERFYCKPGVGRILDEYYYEYNEPIIWERILELLDYQVH